jgi:hypothetical protein
LTGEAHGGNIAPRRVAESNADVIDWRSWDENKFE